ncbi:MAG: hypothetical protein ACYTFZ_05465 [Planctomycetota bacterium]
MWVAEAIVLALAVLEGLLLVIGLALWVRAGAPVPRWLHVVGGALAVLAFGCCVVLAFLGALTWKLLAALLFGLPAAPYVIWFLLGGHASVIDES